MSTPKYNPRLTVAAVAGILGVTGLLMYMNPNINKGTGSSAEQPARQVQTIPAKHAETKAAKQPAAQAHMVSLNTSSKKYHEAGCRFYDCRNCVTVTVDEASRQGGIPCKRCH